MYQGEWLQKQKNIILSSRQPQFDKGDKMQIVEAQH